MAKQAARTLANSMTTKMTNSMTGRIRANSTMPWPRKRLGPPKRVKLAGIRIIEVLLSSVRQSREDPRGDGFEDAAQAGAGRGEVIVAAVRTHRGARAGVIGVGGSRGIRIPVIPHPGDVTQQLLALG